MLMHDLELFLILLSIFWRPCIKGLLNFHVYAYKHYNIFLKRPRINYKIKCTAVPKNFDACRIKKWVAFYIWAIKHRNACVYSCNELLNLAWYKYVYFVAATSTILKQRYAINLQYSYSKRLARLFSIWGLYNTL